MSYEDGKALVDKLDGVEVLWITHSGEKFMTEGLKTLVAEKQ
jgi:thiamine biosynthesis lipoprotein ApbE